MTNVPVKQQVYLKSISVGPALMAECSLCVATDCSLSLTTTRVRIPAGVCEKGASGLKVFLEFAENVAIIEIIFPKYSISAYFGTPSRKSWDASIWLSFRYTQVVYFLLFSKSRYSSSYCTTGNQIILNECIMITTIKVGNILIKSKVFQYTYMTLMPKC